MACIRVIQCEYAVACAAVSPEGQVCAVGHDTVLVISQDGKKHEIRIQEARNAAGLPTDKPLAVGLLHKNVWTWDGNICKAVAELGHRDHHLYSIAFSPNGQLMASASMDNCVRIWETNAWYVPPITIGTHSSYATGVSFSCDNRLLASCARDASVHLYHVLDSTNIVPGPKLKLDRWAHCVEFSPINSKLLACCGDEGLLMLLRVSANNDTIDEKRNLCGHTDAIVDMVFSPCGQKIATASFDRSMRLWSVASSKCLHVLLGHTKIVLSVVFSPNGQQLVSSAHDNTVRVWTICKWSDRTHHLYNAQFKGVVFTVMCVRARLEQGQGLRRYGRRALQLPRLPMELWLLVFEQLAH